MRVQCAGGTYFALTVVKQRCGSCLAAEKSVDIDYQCSFNKMEETYE